MLYATTRNPVDAFTPHRVLTQKRGGDGGLFVPFRLPRFTQEEIQALAGKNFNHNLADALNLLFGSHLSSYDLDLSIGRRALRLQQLGQRILLAECWHNPDWDFRRLVQDLTTLVLGDQKEEPETGGWAATGIRLAVLIGFFGELIREGMASSHQMVDISFVSGDFSGPMAAWYGRQLGLPIGNIVCCCNENAALWDFICHGQLRTDGVARRTLVPEADVLVPDGLERLISAYGGPMETENYVETVRRGATYYIDDGFLNRLRQGLYVTVSSEKRIIRTIPSVYGTHGCLLSPEGALAYAGLEDYRARTGSLRHALVFTEKGAVLDRELVAKAMGVSPEQLQF